MQTTAGWRVKLYELEEQGSWKDRGTGHVEVKYVPELNSPALVINAENTNELLIQSKVVLGDTYELQGATIISWKEVNEEGAITADLAISFQDGNGCQTIWHEINECRAQIAQRGTEQDIAEAVALPVCTLDNLEEIRNIVANPTLSQRNALANTIVSNDAAYLMQLLELFSTCEDLEDEDNLKLLAQALRFMLLLNDSGLLQLVLEDDIFLKVAGCLEYDPELKQKADYREFLTTKAVFRQVVPMTNQTVVEKIKQNFRLKYMKDNMLRPCLDESGVQAVNSLQQFNNTEICDNLFADFEYLTKICECIVDVEKEQRAAGIRFLGELFSLTKAYPIDQRAKWYDPLFERIEIFLPAIMTALRDPASSPDERRMSAEVMVAVLLITPNHIRTAIMDGLVARPPPHITGPMPKFPPGVNTDLAHDNNDCILYVIIRRLVEEDDVGVQEQIADCLKLLLDQDRMTDTNKDAFLQLFFDYYIHWMFTPFVEGCGYTIVKPSNAYHAIQNDHTTNILTSDASEFNPADPVVESQGAVAAASSRRHLCDIFAQCVQSFIYRTKYFILRNKGITRILRLLNSRFRHTHLAAIKFIRAIVETKDEFYYRHIAKHDLFRPLFLRLKQCGNKDTMFSSAVIELVDSIRARNIKGLVAYIVEKYSDDYQVVTHVDTFEQLQLRHEQNNETEAAFEQMRNGTNTADDKRRRAASRKMAELEADEAYFEREDEEEEGGASSLDLLNGYGDENDDEVEDSVNGSATAAHRVVLVDDMISARRDTLEDVDLVQGYISNREHHNGYAPARARANGIDIDGGNLSKDDYYDHLPPLKPKFESDEDITADVFLHGKKLPNGSNNKRPGIGTSTSPRANHNGIAPGLSFTMKKKPRLQNAV